METFANNGPRWLLECRQRFIDPPRIFTPAAEQMLLVNPPWLTRLRFGDALARLIQNKTLRALFREGVVVWGHVIQANLELFNPAPWSDSYTYDRPGEIVFSFDQGAHVPQQLSHVAARQS